MEAGRIAFAASRGGKGIFLAVHVQPGAKNTRLCGMHGEAVKIAVAAPARSGRANDELLSFVAEALGLKGKDLSLDGGPASRHKRIFISGDPEVLIPRVRKWIENP